MPKPYNNNFNNLNFKYLGVMKSFNYLDENDFVKKLRSLKTYCPRAYKDLLFYTNIEELRTYSNGRHYKNLYTSDEFREVYGQIKLIFSVCKGNIVIEDLEPQQFLLEGHYHLLETYRGMPYRNDKDKFKIELMLKRKDIS